MKVNRAELVRVCDLVMPGLAKKEVVEQSTHLIWANNEVSTFSDAICVTHPYPCELEFSVKAEDFYKIITKLPDEFIELDLQDNYLHIKANKTKAGLSTIIGETSMVTTWIDKLREYTHGDNFWKPIPEDFAFGMHICSFSVSRDLTTGVKACCAIKDNLIYTTDNIRASVYEMSSHIPDVLLTSNGITELIKYQITEYGMSENWAHFRTPDGITFNCKTMRGDYPFTMIGKLFSGERKPTLVFPDELAAAVESIVVLASGDANTDKAIAISVNKNVLICKAEKERGWVTKELDIEYDGEPFEFLINPFFFGQVLKHATVCTVENGKAYFKADKFNHVISLPKGV